MVSTYGNIFTKNWKGRFESIEKGPHVPLLTPIVTDGTQTRIGGGQVAMIRPTNNEIKRWRKMK